MNIVQFEIMKNNLCAVSYTALELREFIEQCWTERDRLCKLIIDYERSKIRPYHVKDAGKWISGINTAISEINRLKGIAVRLERDLKGIEYKTPKRELMK